MTRKVGAEGRPDRLIPLLAQAILEAQSVAAGGLRPLAVVAAPRIAPRAARQILRFAQEHAPGVAVGVLDFEGLRLFACLRLVRRKVLFSRWQASGQRSTHEAPQRLVLRGDPLRQLETLLKGQDRACLGLFAAARALNLGLVEGVPPFVYVVRLPHAGRSPWNELRPTRAGESPDVILRKPLAPQSVFRGMVQASAVAASDVIQTWLDVSAHPARGEEQAAFIYDRVLRPVVEKDS